MHTVEFFFDLSSPWTWMAFKNIQPIIRESGATIVWKPFLVGGVFNAVNHDVYRWRENPDDRKYRHSFTWLQEWAKLYGIPMNFPCEHHPVKSVLAMRFCCALQDHQEQLLSFATRAFEAYFTDQKNLDEPEVMVAIADACGLNGSELLEKTRDQVIKDCLRLNTEDAIARGAFGSPTIFVDKDRLYFGGDQLPIIRQALMEG